MGVIPLNQSWDSIYIGDKSSRKFHIFGGIINDKPSNVLLTLNEDLVNFDKSTITYENKALPICDRFYSM